MIFRAFRAVDDFRACEQFMLGHRFALENLGIKKLASAHDDWMTNPWVFVITAESHDRSKVYGGARVHVADGVSCLPIEDAVGAFDSRVHEVIQNHAIDGTGEICGLWNSSEALRVGIGSRFLTRACVVISSQIKLQSLFALCAPYTVKMAENVGYRKWGTVGERGVFRYPKTDILSTAMLLDDVNVLSRADPEEKNKIMTIRSNPTQVWIEIREGIELILDFRLQIPKVEINAHLRGRMNLPKAA